MNRVVEVHIDELVLYGISPNNRYELAAAVETELTRLFCENQPAFAGRAGYADISGRRFNLGKQDSDQRTGHQIAGSVYSVFEQMDKKNGD